VAGAEPVADDVAGQGLGYDYAFGAGHDGGDRTIPRIVVHAFCNRTSSLNLMRTIMQDRRMKNVTMEVHEGGVAAAIQYYVNETTPNLLVIEGAGDPRQLLADLDSLAEYCDENNLPTEARLGLFIQVCQAIQHAHQKGIIHRDIKPSNILVTVNDGVPVPMVIDFGIAKATNQQRLTDKTLFTRFEQFIGTPAYMSPEQAELSGLDIDTRSDIYALGVLLYELLTGKTPFEAMRSAPVMTRSTFPRCMRNPAILSVMSVAGMFSFMSSQAVSRAP
jgi:serine/threonine protein kinase